jgi:DNA-binding response OmpR family regulator
VGPSSADAILQKPFELDELLVVVRDLAHVHANR